MTHNHTHEVHNMNTPVITHWSQLDDVTLAYAECALWSSSDWDDMVGDNPRPLDDNYGIEDIAPETLAAMAADVAAFIEANASDLDDSGLDDDQIGHDFWLTRNGHGAGFWDRGLGDVGERLTDACRPYGECNLYVGDDGKVSA